MTLRTRPLAAGVLAAVLMLAPVACSDDGDDAGSTVEQDETTTTLEGGADENPDEGTDATDGTEPDEGNEGGDQTSATVVTPPEAQAFCDKLDSMNDVEPESLDEIRSAFGELDDVVPDEIREPYDSLMDRLSAASSEDDLEDDPEAEADLIALSTYAMSNCNT